MRRGQMDVDQGRSVSIATVVQQHGLREERFYCDGGTTAWIKGESLRVCRRHNGD